MLTNAKEIRQNLKICEKKPIQLVNLRWQAVGILIALVSVFWAAIISSIFSKNQDFGVIYLSIFSGIIFSILILFVWRWINHVMYEEEFGCQKGVFILRQLLKDPHLNDYSLMDIRDKIDIIIKGQMKIVFFEECLKNEFGEDSLYDLYYKHHLKDEEKQNLRKRLYNKWFEKGQWKFDLISFGIIIFLWGIGWCLLFLISQESSNYQIFKLFKENIGWVIFFYGVVLYPIFMYGSEYLFRNFIWPGTRRRRNKIRDFISNNCRCSSID